MPFVPLTLKEDIWVPDSIYADKRALVAYVYAALELRGHKCPKVPETPNA